MSDYVMLKNVRINFFKGGIWIPSQYEGKGEFNYQAQFVITPGSDNDKKIRERIDQRAQKAWGKKWKEILETVWGRPKDCAYYKGDLKEYDGYAGNMVLSTKRNKTKGPVLVLDRVPDKNNPLTIEDGKPYPGCYVNAAVDPWCQEAPYLGVRCTLVTIQYVKDGDAFGSGPATADGFEEVEESTEDVSDLV